MTAVIRRTKWLDTEVGTGAILGTTTIYVGPGDVVSGALAWWGLRAYTSASIGSNVVKIRRSSDSTTKVFVSIVGGGINTSDPFLDGSNYFVDTLYDQTGNSRDLTQATTANQPQFKLAQLGTFPGMVFVAATPLWLHSAATITQAQPFCVSSVFMCPTGATGSGDMLSVDNGEVDIGHGSDDFTSRIYSGAVLSDGGTGRTTADVFLSLQGLWNGVSSQITTNNASSTGSAGTGTPSAGHFDMGSLANGAALKFDGTILEAGMWGSDISSSFSSLYTNQHSYWGFP